MPWSSTNLPDATKNLSKPDKKKFAEIANAILAETKDEGKAISIALAQLKKEQDEPLRYVEAPVYISNIYKLSDEREYTICESCNEVNEVSESDGYCKSCENPLGDYHGDLIDSDNVEKLMFSYMENINERIIKLDQMVKDLLLGNDVDLMEYIKASKHHIGLGHTIFSKDNGCLISSYLKREEIDILGEKVEKVSWVQGTKVSPEIFDKIKAGECKSYSFGAKGNRVKLNTGIK